MGPRETLRKVVAEALIESELPRTLVARDSGLGRASLEAWISGLRNPSPESLAQVADALEARGERLLKLAGRVRGAITDPGAEGAPASEGEESGFTGRYVRRGGRGRYVAGPAEGVDVVTLDADVAAVFPDSASVNRALRALAKIIKEQGGGPAT